MASSDGLRRGLDPLQKRSRYVCDVRGEKTFPQETAERLATILDSKGGETPTAFLQTPVFDLAAIDAARAGAKKQGAA